MFESGALFSDNGERDANCLQITLSDEDQTKLLRGSRGGGTPARLVLRANIVLVAAERLRNEDIAEKRQMDRMVVPRYYRQKHLPGRIA